MAGSMTSAFKDAMKRKQERNFDQAAAQLHKELAALGPEAVHVNLGPNNPRTQALYQASRELAKRKVN